MRRNESWSHGEDGVVPRSRTNMSDFERARGDISDGETLKKAELMWKLKKLDTKCVTLGIIAQIALELGVGSKEAMASKIEEAMALGLENKALPSSRLYQECPWANREAVKEALGEFVRGLRGSE